MKSNSSLTRRTFLALGATTAASLAATARVSATTSANPSGSIRIGVIGLGARGLELLDDLVARQSQLRVVAVSDVHEPRLQRAATLSNAEAVRDWRALVDRKDIDAVVIATPNHWHAPMAIAAMQAGKDVYVETPMTHTLAEAKDLRDVAVSTGRCVQVGAQETSHGQWHAAGALVRSGQIGKIQWCQASERVNSGAQTTNHDAHPGNLNWDAWQGPAPKRDFEPQRFLHWRNYWDYSGGIAANEFFHRLAPLLLTIGPEFPERVSAAGGIYLNDGREAPDSFVMSAEYASGHTIVLASSPAHAQGTPAVIRGSYATVYFDRGKVNVVPERHTDDVGNLLARTAPTETVVPTRPSHMDNWLHCIRTRERCVCDPELGYRAMAAIAMAVEAYRDSKTLYWNPLSETAMSAPLRGTLV